MALFEVKTETKQNIYTKKSQIPQYIPSDEAPNIAELCDWGKYAKLLSEINQSNDLSPEEKQFLRFAASRHIVFNYSKIADYYAHATKHVQELMEKSALVLIDIDDAIANGYVQLSKDIDDIMKTSGEKANAK